MNLKKLFPVAIALLVVVISALIVYVLAQDGTLSFQRKPSVEGDEAVVHLVSSGQSLSHASIDDFERFIRETDEPILVDFWAEWCGPCRAAAPFVEELARDYDGRARIVKVNVDLASDLGARYGAQAIPFFVVFSKGQPVDSLAGYSPAHEGQIRQMIDGLLA